MDDDSVFTQDDSDEGEGYPGQASMFSNEPEEEASPAAPPETQAVPVDDNSSDYAQPVALQGNQDPESFTENPETDSDGGGDSSVSPYTAPAVGSTPSQPSSGAPMLPTLPVYGDNKANQQELEYAKSHFNPSDYKPSGWRRLGAALAGGAVAFGSRNPAEGMKVAESVNNAPLARAQADEQQRESAINQKISDVNAQNQTLRTGYEDQRQQVNDQALNDQRQAQAQNRQSQAQDRDNAIVQFTPKDPDNPYAGGSGVTAAGKTVDNITPPDKWLTNWERDPANKAKAQANAGVQTLHALEASGVKLTPEQRAIVASGGKVTPSVRTTISIREKPDGTPITPKSQAMTQAQKDVIVQAKTKMMNDAQQQMGQGLMKPDDALKQMQAAQDGFEQKLGVDTNGPDHLVINPDFTWSKGGQKVSQPAAQPSSPAAAPQASSATSPHPSQQPGAKVNYNGQTLTVGQKIMVNGKPASFMGLGPTGKVIPGPWNDGQ